MRRKSRAVWVAGVLGALALAVVAGAVAGDNISGGPTAQLVGAAKAEGKLNTIALPPDWANYGEIMSAFQKKYGIKITNANPNGSSAEENQAVVSLKGQSRAPDVVDDGPAFAIQGAQQGLFAPYKVSTWPTIPASMKDPAGRWVGDYWGVISFGVNTKVVKDVPRTWADLLKPEYKNMIALNGDPREAGAALAAVFAASLGNGGSVGNVEPGITFFQKLKQAGNLLPVDATPATIASGQTPITIDWDYLQLSYKKEVAKQGIDWQVVVPTQGRYGAFYAQAINASGPNPNAAKLWEEFLYSDQGQLLFLKGGTHPARFADLAKRGVIPKSMLAQLPPASDYTNVNFASDAQQTKGKNLVASEWGSKVAGT
jgi:putative spermidine/putrescine transport system substrate-binding protein